MSGIKVVPLIQKMIFHKYIGSKFVKLQEPVCSYSQKTKISSRYICRPTVYTIYTIYIYITYFFRLRKIM